MSTFLGIGLGPIQTSIFLNGAAAGGCTRLVVAEVDPELVAAVRRNQGQITINIARQTGIVQQTIAKLEVFNPQVETDLPALLQAAAEASDIATALPGVALFPKVANWLRQGFALAPDRRRFVYTAENDNHAAEKLRAAIAADFPDTHYLNTVIGKMSKVFTTGETAAGQALPTLCPGYAKGHLVEAFDRILIDDLPGIQARQVAGLHPKANLLAFEEAKLYGHNAVHFLLGWQAAKLGLTYMSEAANCAELLAEARHAFVAETGQALVRKWAGSDELFTPAGFAAYADDLLARMTNPYLDDAVVRVIRDLPRKLAPRDRVMGTIALCLAQDILPATFIKLAADCLANCPPPGAADATVG